jgi:hypothetical protein
MLGSVQHFQRRRDPCGSKSYWPPSNPPTLNPVVLLVVTPGGVLNMTPAEEQLLLNTLKVIALDIKMVVYLLKQMSSQQDTASQKTLTQLVNIAHKRM